MFEGAADEAMRFYVAQFPGSEILELVRYAPGEPGREGSVKHGMFRLGDQVVLCTDTEIQHGFTFTRASSLFVTCDSEEEIRRLAVALPEGGSTLMPLDNYGFSRQFAWVSDRFGVSWQLNLP